MNNNFLITRKIYFGDLKSKEYISNVCRDIIEDLLKETYDEENPLATSLEKCSRSTQTNLRDYCDPLLKKKENLSKFFKMLLL